MGGGLLRDERRGDVRGGIRAHGGRAQVRSASNSRSLPYARRAGFAGGWVHPRRGAKEPAAGGAGSGGRGVGFDSLHAVRGPRRLAAAGGGRGLSWGLRLFSCHARSPPFVVLLGA